MGYILKKTTTWAGFEPTPPKGIDSKVLQSNIEEVLVNRSNHFATTPELASRRCMNWGRYKLYILLIVKNSEFIPNMTG